MYGGFEYKSVREKEKITAELTTLRGMHELHCTLVVLMCWFCRLSHFILTVSSLGAGYAYSLIFFGGDAAGNAQI